MKVVEKIVQNQLVGYLETHYLLTDEQHGYRRYHSTESALHVVTDKVLQAMDDREISILTLLDQSKCFDVIPHRMLLDKFSAYGIDTEWFDSYLTGHTQQVLIRGTDGTAIKSDPKPNNIGVYQGGSLSCVMYMLFANDLALHVQSDVTVVQYADDVQLLLSGKKQHLPQLIMQMENALETLYQWFCHHSLKVNEQKTQMVVLGTPAMLRNMQPVTISFNGSQIPDSKQVKNLGVTIDRHLNYQAHIDDLTRRCTGTLMALNHARHVIPRSTLASIVQALVLSSVRYCMSVYGSCSETQIERVQKIINFGARVVSGRRRRDHISDVVRELNWMSAKQLYQYHAVCNIRSAIVTQQPAYIHHTIGVPANQLHSHDTRRADRRTVPLIQNEAGRRRLCYSGVSMLNELNVNAHTPRFRSKLKRAILERAVAH